MACTRQHSRQLQLPKGFPVRRGGEPAAMRSVIRRRVRRRTGGVDLAVDVNAVVATNYGTSGVESVQSTAVPQAASARAADEGRERPAENQDQSPEEER